MEELIKTLVNAGPGVARFILAAALATLAAGLVYDRFMRGESGPPIREIAPMLAIVGLVGGLVLSRLFRVRSRK